MDSVVTKTVSEIKTDEQGRQVRVTRTIRMKLVTEVVEADVAARRQWAKFGDASKDGPGPNAASTLIGEPVYLKLAMDQDFDKLEVAAQVPVVEARSVKCKYCEGPHWSVKCPYKDTFAGADIKINHGQGGGAAIAAAMAETSASAAATAGKYVPRHRRDDAEGGSSAAAGTTTGIEDRDQGLAIRIYNLSDVVVEDDIRELCSALGCAVARCNVGRDRMTGRCKGYAFVNFYTKADADTAVARLNNLPYGNLIIKAEIAKPLEK